MALSGDFHNPLVSIIIPAFNSERWIEETIKSALAQTWKNKEIIIVDDGSRDNTFNVAKKYQSKSVYVISKKNNGASSARNKGLSFAQGDYIQWLDSDDILAPDKIELQLKDNVGAPDSRVLLSSAFGMFYYRVEKAIFNKTPLWKDIEPIDYFLKKFIEDIWMQPATWLVSRKLTELAGPWNEKLSLDDDGEYFCRVVAASEKIKFVAGSKSYYRIGNMGSLSKSKSNKALESVILSTSLCFDYLRSLEDSERTRAACLKYLNNRLWNFYPENFVIMEMSKKLAQKLGGDLLPYRESFKFSLIRRIFGWKIATSVKEISWIVKISALRNWDRLLYKLNTMKWALR